MVKALVTGGAGFIGSNLVERLVELGHEVSVIDDLSLGKEENLENVASKIKFYKMSICDDLNNMFKDGKFDWVFHVAALPRVQFSIQNPEKTHEANVQGTFNLLIMSKKHGVERFIFSSSSSVYGNQEKMPLSEEMEANPISPYALHKLIGEHYCNLFYVLYGLKTVSLRYFNVYGPKQDPFGDYACLIPKFVKMINSDMTPTINGDGEQTRDFTFVDDVVSANIAATTTDNPELFGKAFNVGSGSNKSVNEVTSLINNILQKEIAARHGPVVIEPKNTLADVSKISDFFGWKPKVRFEEGLEKTIKWFT